MARTPWILLCLLMLSLPAQARDVVVLGIFPDRAMLEVDGKRQVMRVGERSEEGVHLLSTDSRAGHVVLDINGQRRQVALGGRAGGNFQARESARAQIYADSRGAYTTTGSINGRTITFLVDTGATSIAMSSNEAQRLGIDYTRGQLTQARTASGTTFAYEVTLDRVRVGEIEQRNVRALVLPGNSPHIALLGMTFLSRVEMRNEGQALILEQRF